MREKITVNQEGKYTIFIIVLMGFGLMSLFPFWKERVISGLLFFIGYFGIIDSRAIWDVRNKKIIKRKPFFRKVSLKIKDVDSIKYVFGGALNVPNSVNLSFNGVDKCACIHLNEGEFIELFDEIYDNADRNKLTWNTGMEDFEPFVKSKFGAIIKS